MDPSNPGISDKLYNGIGLLTQITELIDGQAQRHLPAAERIRPTILIFLPGILEIQTLYKVLEVHA